SGEPLRVVVLAGGRSAEREVSLRSGAAVQAALAAAGHDAVLRDPAWRKLESLDWPSVDACFVALHGGEGEDGRVQQQLERLGVPYPGSGPAACRLAMSKSASKQRFAELGVPSPPFALLAAYDSPAVVDSLAAPLGYPLVVKPDSQGSSLGVSLADSAEAL